MFINIYQLHLVDWLTTLPDPSLPSRTPPSLTRLYGPLHAGHINEGHVGFSHTLASMHQLFLT